MKIINFEININFTRLMILFKNIFHFYQFLNGYKKKIKSEKLI